MSITPEQREARRQSIGSSDIAAILGIHPHLTQADIWLSKVEQLEEPDQDADWIVVGNFLEPAVLEWAGSELGCVLDTDPPTVKNGIFHAHPDGYGEVDGKKILVEAKTGQSDGYGEQYTDHVPAHVFVQVQWQMMLTNRTTCYVAAALASDYGIRFRMYVVDYDAEMCLDMAEKGRAWWEEFVVARKKPGAEPPRLQMLKRVRRTPGTSTQVDQLAIKNWLEAKDGATAWAAREKEARAELLYAMGDAEAAVSEKLGWAVTYLTQKRRGYTVEPGEYRVMRRKRLERD